MYRFVRQGLVGNVQKYHEYKYRISVFINPTQTKVRCQNIANHANPLFKRRQATFLKPEFSHVKDFVSGSDITSIKLDVCFDLARTVDYLSQYLSLTNMNVS